MLSSENIIYFANDWNPDNRTSSHHIAQQLAKTNRLLFVESPGTRGVRASKRDLGRALRKVAAALRGARRVTSNVFVSTLFLIPLNGYEAIRRLNRRLVVAPIRRACRRLSFNDPIVWLTTPHVEYVVGQFNEKLSVYYCVDDYSQLPGVDVAALRQMEDRLLERVDVVFVTSETLLARLSARHRNVHLAPHGVDVSHFSKALDPALSPPPEMAKFRGPIIGFIGLIEQWVDMDLLRFIARARPEWSLVLIGRIADGIQLPSDLPNVHFLGARPYSELPSYAKTFDVAIIPFLITELTRSVNPLKLYEYLAAGLPVVSTPLPAVQQYSSVVKIASTHDAFVDHITHALAENRPDDVDARVRAVAVNTWERRAENVSTVIVNMFASHRAGRASSHVG